MFCMYCIYVSSYVWIYKKDSYKIAEHNITKSRNKLSSLISRCLFSYTGRSVYAKYITCNVEWSRNDDRDLTDEKHAVRRRRCRHCRRCYQRRWWWCYFGRCLPPVCLKCVFTDATGNEEKICYVEQMTKWHRDANCCKFSVQYNSVIKIRSFINSANFG